MQIITILIINGLHIALMPEKLDSESGLVLPGAGGGGEVGW